MAVSSLQAHQTLVEDRGRDGADWQMGRVCRKNAQMPKTPTAKASGRSEEAILDQAVKQLLRATKESAKRKGQPTDPAQLRKEGYSERFIDQVEKEPSDSFVSPQTHKLADFDFQQRRRARASASACVMFAESARTI
ncbi:MAG: hypothetical protein ACREP1_03635 [Rhodanobacteraceae bacterium]